MKIFLNILIVVLFFSTADNSWAQSAQELTWDDAQREAKANNPDLISSKEKLKQVKASRAITKSGTRLQITSDLSETSSKSPGRNRTDTYNYGVNAQQLLFDGFKTTFDIKEADENVKAAQYNYAVTSSNVRLNLKIAFIDLIDAQQSLIVAKDIAKRRLQNLDLVQLRYEGGAEHKGSLLTEKANAAQAQFDIEQAERNIELSQRRLVKAIGWKEFKPVVAKGNLSIEAIEKSEPAFENMVDTIPLLQELSAQKEAARLGVKSAKASFFPQIYANGSLGKSDSSWPPSPTAWSAGLSLSFPVFEGGSKQAELDKARAVFGQAQADEKSGRDAVIYTLAQTWTQWQNSTDNVGIQQQFLDAAKERAKIAEAQYGAGLIKFNEWIIIENDLVGNQKSFLNAQANALIAEANWVQAKGETIDE